MDAPDIQLDLSKPYTIEFHGGPSDGVVLRTDSDDAREKDEAIGTLFLTKSGTIGKGMMGKAPGTSFEDFFRNIVSTPEGPKLIGEPPQAHEYRVTDRREEEGRVLVRFDYKGIRSDKQD